MVLNPLELSLNIKPTYIPKTISEFLGEVSAIGNVSERLMKIDDFVKRLEDEMRKIDAFKRELPLSMLLINDAIDALKEELIQCRRLDVEPVLEEFLPLKKSCDVDEKDETRKQKKRREKMNWLTSVPLWNTTESPNTDFNYNPKQISVGEIKKSAEVDNRSVTGDLHKSCKSRTAGRAFMPFKGYSPFPVVAIRREDKEELPVAGLSLMTPGIKNPREELGSTGLSLKTSISTKAVSSFAPSAPNLQTGLQSSRKQRRSWSQELHKRFVNVLQQLGGAQAATPKQIKELMQVDGLTNDEVKSHLQKYRLHTRRVPATATPANQSLAELGGLWMPQDQHGESSKQSNSQSGSPQGPLQLTRTTGGTSTTLGDSVENEEDEKSESYSWKSHVHTSGKDDE